LAKANGFPQLLGQDFYLVLDPLLQLKQPFFQRLGVSQVFPDPTASLRRLARRDLHTAVQSGLAGSEALLQRGVLGTLRFQRHRLDRHTAPGAG